MLYNINKILLVQKTVKKTKKKFIINVAYRVEKYENTPGWEAIHQVQP